MTTELKDLLSSVMTDDGVEFDVRLRYSGRGAMGKETVAVVLGDHQTLLGVVALAGAKISTFPYGFGGFTNPAELAAQLRRLRFDNIGSDLVIY